jgi:hypothetical protein
LSSSILVPQSKYDAGALNDFKGEKNQMYGKSAEQEKQAIYSQSESNNATPPLSMPSDHQGRYLGRLQSLRHQMTREHYIVVLLLLVVAIYIWKR